MNIHPPESLLRKAMLEVECPKCHAAPGKRCVKPTRRPTTTHYARIAAYREKIGEEEFDKRHTITR